tara:strand:+ start:215 stop:475 length:261 start_codon:yes stop_codon:yes gene_type:complete
MKFFVTFKYSSSYEDENENKIAEHTLEYEAKNLDELWSILENEDYDDEIVINFSAKSNCLATERDEIRIMDENNKIVWEDNLDISE